MHRTSTFRLAGALAGTVNGLFGGGGGIPLVLLLRRGGLSQKQALANCVAAVLPLSAVSAGVYLFRAELSLFEALPYLVGGSLGGLLGGRLFRRLPGLWLRRSFALFLLYGGIRYLT